MHPRQAAGHPHPGGFGLPFVGHHPHIQNHSPPNLLGFSYPDEWWSQTSESEGVSVGSSGAWKTPVSGTFPGGISGG